MTRLRSLVANFARDAEGSIAIVFGLSCIVLFGLIGLATDTSRYYNYASHMQQALDAATLAGAKMLPDDSVNDSDIIAVIRANYMQSMRSAGVAARDISEPIIDIDRPTNTVIVDGSSRLPAMFANILNGDDRVEIKRTSRVVFDRKLVELSMVLDITGSMNSNNKLADMKIAAKDVIDELYNASLSENDVRIALAPYSASVNAGDLAAAVTAPTPSNQCSQRPQRGQNCEDASGVAIDTCVIERQGVNAATAAAPVGTDVLPTVPSTPYGNYVCPASTVVPLTGKSDQNTLKAILDGYVANGSTAGHIGAAWGWYLLSPEWAAVLGASAPKAYGSDGVNKSMIIMTDGIFNTSYLSGSATSAAAQADESYAQFDALCDGIKAKGIQVFTVGFALNDARALSELANCASSPGTFFDAQTGADLKASFHSIAQKLNTLRVAG